MKDYNKYLNKDNFLEGIIKNRKENAKFSYVSPSHRTPNRIPTENKYLNRINIKELTNFADRPNLLQNNKSRTLNLRYISEEKRNIRTEICPENQIFTTLF